MVKCGVVDCEQNGSLRCSNCHLIHYCSVIHQKLDWKCHKNTCKLVKSTVQSQNKISENDLHPKFVNEENLDDSGYSADPTEKRECRCMFCGNTMLLDSEEAAIAHMQECPALLEQLSSKDQFTIPSSIQEKMAKSNVQFWLVTSWIKRVRKQFWNFSVYIVFMLLSNIRLSWSIIIKHSEMYDPMKTLCHSITRSGT